MLIGGVAFPFFAAAYYWLPKYTGKLLDERFGKANFWLMFVGLHLTFGPMHIVGLMGMPRRVYTYEAGQGWDIYNLLSTIGAFVIFAGIVVFLVNLVYTHFRGEPAGAQPVGRRLAGVVGLLPTAGPGATRCRRSCTAGTRSGTRTT